MLIEIRIAPQFNAILRSISPTSRFPQFKNDQIQPKTTPPLCFFPILHTLRLDIKIYETIISCAILLQNHNVCQNSFKFKIYDNANRNRFLKSILQKKRRSQTEISTKKKNTHRLRNGRLELLKKAHSPATEKRATIN